MDNVHKIIDFLGKNIFQSFTMRELSKILQIPYASFYRTIQDIKDLLIIQSVGKSKTIQLNKNNPVVKAYLTVASDEEKKEFLSSQPIINKIVNETDSKDILLLFGSYAKKTQHEKSDMDLLIINKNGKRSISFSKYELLFKKKINPLFVTEKEFQLMLKQKEENVGTQALKNHIILNNPARFWECVFYAV